MRPQKFQWRDEQPVAERAEGAGENCPVAGVVLSAVGPAAVGIVRLVQNIHFNVPQNRPQF